ncbi:MAG TPA: hypothetical protein DCG75_09240 [Bacteroidales bacterium]|nr:hypothetical protein [Bacteroidales bacterium]
MKKTIKLLSFAFFAAAILMSCEGPEGPAGTDGTDGIDGVDGTLACLECHSATVMDAIVDEFSLTKHATGSSWARGTSASCGRCHSHDAYVEFVRSGEEIAAAVSTPVECGTCHSDHQTLEGDVSAPIREIDGVVAMVNSILTFDHGKGNICATCHQSRRTGAEYDKYTANTMVEVKLATASADAYTEYKAELDAGIINLGTNGSITYDNGVDSLFVEFDVTTDMVLVTSTHAGPHHGPQANTFAGITGYPTAGVEFDRAGHTDCVSCHLNDTTAASGFGHSFEPDVAQCDACHGTAVDLEGIQADFQARIDPAVEELIALHILGDGGTATSNYTVADVHPMIQMMTRAQYQAFYNIMCILEDKSLGIHNVDYTDQMLDLVENSLGLK